MIVTVIAQLGFELAYYDVTIQLLNHYTTVTTIEKDLGQPLALNINPIKYKPSKDKSTGDQ